MTTDWTKLPRADMEANIRSHMNAAISGNHGDWIITGSDLAALALREAMSEISEECWCATWHINLGDIIWAWLRGEQDLRPWGVPDDDFAAERQRIIALACVSEVWWPDYDYAVTLTEWIEAKGEAPGVATIR